MEKFSPLLLAILICLLVTNADAKIIIAAPPELPADLLTNSAKELTADRSSLLRLFNSTQEFINRQAENCRGVEVGSAKVSECVAQASAVKAATKEYRTALQQFGEDLDDAKYAYSVATRMKALARKLGWSDEEQDRLDKALNTLGGDGAAVKDRMQIFQTWQEMLARGEGGNLAREASQGQGPGFPGAGEQTRYKDCAIFALANAAGVPYGVVAARATEFISAGEWHSADERARPQEVIEKIGLNGGEVIMLAESLGQVEVVPRTKFAEVLKEGRPIMVNVVPRSGAGGHQVVLTKSFQHEGATWYEMMDSNQGPLRRLYLSDTELKSILQENGVVFRPEPGTVPMLLR